MGYGPLAVKVWGEFACFTRPEMKVERVSYPVMTPAAARGLLEAIFWKPEFSWQVREIQVLKPIRYFSLIRNEVNSVASHLSARGWQKHGGGYFADEDRAQRHTLALREVAYIIKAEPVLKPHANADPAKYRDQFRRRVARGQFHHAPYLGCREFAAGFGEPEPADRPLPLDMDLGLMLFDLEYQQNDRGLGVRGQPRFFPARLEQGVMRIDPSLYG
ncbi:MAG: type I-C CRISPR-associated protein Cas5 [Deltaproteobacteria bacterium]|nr:type I-C CRISPR-associated protein Cas5 [Deltaproteobacteria bacterium]MBW1991426.1 type I-C CRISPR-associated protein Cas5 [Deltaproteobacteria bacterium]